MQLAQSETLQCGMNKEESMNTVPETELVQRAQSGDRDAFARLYETHKQKVYAICLRITRERMEAEDCTQEAFMQCFLRLATFRADSSLSTWLHLLKENVFPYRLRA